MSKGLIVLLTSKFSDRVSLLNNLWRGAGYSTCLIYCMDSLVFEKKNNFDLVIKASDPQEAVAICSKIEKKIIHYFNYGPDLLGQILISANLPYIYDYKDLFFNVRSSGIADALGALEVGIISRALLITNRDDQIYNYLDKNQIKFELTRTLPTPEFFVSDIEYEQSLILYEELRNNSNEIKVVMTGGFDISLENKIETLYEGADKIVDFLLMNDVKLTIIGGYSNVNTLNVSCPQSVNHNHLTVHKALNSKDFDYELLNHDYAIHMVNNDINSTLYSEAYRGSKHLEFCGSARIVSYIKAGLPILSGRTMLFNNKILEGSGFCVNIDNSLDLKNFLKNLRNSGYRNKLIKKRKLFEHKKAQEIFNENLIRLNL